jgi:hypothetical protein
MRKSKKVMLSAVFLSAIAVANARAQDVNVSAATPAQNTEDSSTRVYDSSYIAPVPYRSYSWFRFNFISWNWFFRRTHHREHGVGNANVHANPTATVVHRPRTSGFGNTIRKSSGAHS